MKAYSNPGGLLAAIVAVIIVFISASLYEAGIISDEFYLKLISVVEKETVMESHDLEVHFIDVGQAECILIEAPEKTLLIDAGEVGCGNDITNYLHSNGVFSIDVFITTHPHSDHIGSAEHILKNFPVSEVVMPEIPDEYLPTTALFEDLLRSLAKENCSVSYAKTGKSYDLGSGASLEVLAPSGNLGDNLNNYSVVTKLVYGETSFLFTGDIEKEAENAILSSGADISCTVYNAGHHGSSTSNTSAFLDAASPEYAAVSCGKNNDYGHPHKEVVAAFRERGITCLRTDYDGNIIFGSDGKEIFIRTTK